MSNQLREAAEEVLRTNGGPIDGVDTTDGKPYVMVELAAFTNLDAAVRALVDKYRLAMAAMTEAQLADAVKQAIACGDFRRLVRAGDNAQSVVYIPFAREQELLERIRGLERALRDSIQKKITVCPGCLNEIDTEVCHCGNYIKSHTIYDGHSPVPMGCTCGYATS